jgi:purine-binding chemotaxis protein CheW
MSAQQLTQPDASVFENSTDVSEIAGDGNQFLTFRLMDEEYGIDILRVQEIRNFSKITPIPNTPHYIKGAMNLRGTVVPIIDLRRKFDMPEIEYNQYTVIIVVTVGSRVMGLIVDAVSDVLNVGDDDLEPAPNFGGDVDTSFLTGLAKCGDRLITLLNIEKLSGIEEVTPVG